MVTFFLETLLLALGSGIVGAVYRGVLAYEPVLNWWFRFGNRYEGRWFFAPVWGCVKCISGQLALWFYLFIEILPAWTRHGGQISTIGRPALYYTANPAAFILGLILAICGAILTAIILAPIIKKLENR